MALTTLSNSDVIGGISKLEVANHLDFSGFNPATFASGKDWQEIEMIPESGELKLKAEDSDHGVIFQYTASFAIDKLRPEVNSALFPFLGQVGVYRITDLNGMVHIIGAPGKPVTLSLDATTGAQYTSQNGYGFSLSIQQEFPALTV